MYTCVYIHVYLLYHYCYACVYVYIYIYTHTHIATTIYLAARRPRGHRGHIFLIISMMIHYYPSVCCYYMLL